MIRSILIIISSLSFFLSHSYAQTDEADLYQKAFGKKSNSSLQQVSLFEGSYDLGEIGVFLTGETLVSIDKKSLVIALRDRLTSESYQDFLLNAPNPVPPTYGELSFTYNPTELRVEINLPLTLSVPRVLRAQSLGLPLSEQGLESAPLALAITTRADQVFSDNALGPEGFQAQFDSFIHFKGFVLENQSNYQSYASRAWYRADTRIVKDDAKNLVRYQAGDLNNQVMGFLPFKQFAGISISRNFSLNPYRSNLPAGTQDFTLESRSQVKTFVNGTLIRTEDLPAGRYQLADIPLTNGLNAIRIEALDELGSLKIFEFQQSSSFQLLHAGESRFDLSAGVLYEDRDRKREYLSDDPKLISGLYQYGLSEYFTMGAFGQVEGDFSLAGLEHITALPLGLITMAAAQGRNDQRSGQIYSLGYQLSRLGRLWSDSHQLNFSVDYRDEDFQSSRVAMANTLSTQYRIQYSLPISDFLSTSLGFSLGKLRQNLEDRRTVDLGVNLRITNGINLSAFGSRTYDEFNKTSDQVYAFVTFSFPDYGHYVQGAYNSNDQSYRLSVNNDQQNRLNSFRTQASVETNQRYQEARGDVLFNSAFAEVGLRAQTRKNEFESSHLNRTQLRLATSFVMVADKGSMRAEFTRPITQSFALFHLENGNGEPLSLRGAGLYEEAARGPFGHSVFTNLLPYQQRALRVDSLQLAAGKSFSEEYFILNPIYRSGHLITLTVASEKVIKGVVMTSDQKILALQSGQLTESSTGKSFAFFTNRQGEFFIEGIQSGDYQLTIDNYQKELSLNSLEENDVIVHDLGTLTLSIKERL